MEPSVIFLVINIMPQIIKLIFCSMFNEQAYIFIVFLQQHIGPFAVL